jgi:hypothetical protein
MRDETFEKENCTIERMHMTGLFFLFTNEKILTLYLVSFGYPVRLIVELFECDFKVMIEALKASTSSPPWILPYSFAYFSTAMRSLHFFW